MGANSLLYGPRTASQPDMLAEGGQPWSDQRYLRAFGSLPKRRLYFEHREPEQMVIVLDGPVLRAREPADPQNPGWRRLHVAVSSTQFLIVFRNHTDPESRSGGLSFSGHANLGVALGRLRGENEVFGTHIPDRGAQTVFSRQDFHDAFVSLLAGRTAIEPVSAPAVARDQQCIPSRWLADVVTSAHTLHRRYRPGIWVRFAVSGWEDTTLRTMATAVVRDPASDAPVPEALKKAVERHALITYTSADGIDQLYECPAYQEDPVDPAAGEADPRNLEPLLAHPKFHRQYFRTPPRL